MKKLLIFSFLAGTICFAQSPQRNSYPGHVQGDVFTIPNTAGSQAASFEYVMTPTPASVSISIAGCMRGTNGQPGAVGTCDSAAETYASTANSVRSPTFSKVYDTFQITVTTLSAGTTLTVNTTIVVSKVGTSSGGGSGGLPAGLAFASPTLTVSTAGSGNGALALSGNTSGTCVQTVDATSTTISQNCGQAYSGAQGALTTISTSTANANLILAPNGTGAVVLPVGAATTPGVLFNGLTTGFWSTAANVNAALGNANSSFAGYNGATNLFSIAANGAAGGGASFRTGVTGNMSAALASRLTTAVSQAAVSIGNIGTISFTGTAAGTQTGVSMGTGASAVDGELIFAPTSGSTNFNAVSIVPQINQTGGANGAITGLLISPTNTALVGTENLIDMGVGGTGGLFNVSSTGNVKPTLYGSQTNCASSAGTCAAAPDGSVSIAAAASTVTVATTAVTANSVILLTRDDTLGTKLSVTCNTATAAGDIKVSTRTANTSFVITVQNAPATNPLCLNYMIVN